ncbi:hypothetical protein [Nonomuraea fuscirosea]|uniref:hypothetical protein n=1 Tax=Nonomuraea fuscirosea TaxID=1291556 RepID=UPI0033DE14B0
MAAPPARADVPVCLPETRVCAGLDDGRFAFTIRPRPTTLAVDATVNGTPVTGSLTHFTGDDHVQGWYEPYPPLVPGDVMCLAITAPEVPPGPYCDTAP